MSAHCFVCLEGPDAALRQFCGCSLRCHPECLLDMVNRLQCRRCPACDTPYPLIATSHVRHRRAARCRVVLPLLLLGMLACSCGVGTAVLAVLHWHRRPWLIVVALALATFAGFVLGHAVTWLRSATANHHTVFVLPPQGQTRPADAAP